MTKRFFVILYLGLLATFPLDATAQQTNHQAPFVWVDAQGFGRQQYVYFRRDFSLEALPGQAEFNLFVDSRYHLFVNGVMINFGPVRFYPQNPEYDTYDIAPYLQKGENTIAVKALSNGTNTYQVPRHRGGFTAWGQLKAGSQTIDLATPGAWQCRRCEAYNPTSPKMSFATGPFEVFDARKDIPDWNKPGIELIGWRPPVKIKEQTAWGKLSPRSIPHLTQDEVVPKNILGIYTLDDSEAIYSFRVKTPDSTRAAFGQSYRVFAYTYIYSPKAQKVKVGTFWGEFFLNGQGPLGHTGEVAERPNRQDRIFDLKEGWNFMLVKYDVVWASWDFYMALPKSAGLKISPNKKIEDETAFMSAGPFKESEKEKVMSLELPFESPKDLPRRLSKTWYARLKSERAHNPAWLMAWKYFDKALPHEPSKIENIELKNPETAIVVDMGGKLLGRIVVEYEATEGTMVDVGFTEDLTLDGKRPWILKRAGVYAATRHISAGGDSRLETFKPYGVRYLQINVFNAGNKPVKIKRIAVISQIYPFERVGSFQCSDPMFNAIWELGWRSLRVCSEDSYTDTPYRERGLYAGDALPEFAITLATSGDARLIRRSLLVFQDMYANLLYPDGKADPGSVGLLGDFPFITMQYFAWYVNWTNDLEFARQLYPNYKYMLDNALALRDYKGLIKARRVFAEWTQITKSDFYSTAFNGLVARSCYTMAQMADKLGKTDDKKHYEAMGDELTGSLQAASWDADKGAYRDGFKDGKAIDEHYPISSAWLSLYGLTTEVQEKSLEQHYARELADIGNKSRHRRATPYGGFYQLGALYRHGYVETAEMFMRKYWSPMILKHDDTAWENFDDGSGEGGQGTLSHAWSGGPTYYLSTQVLGVPLGFPQSVDYDNLVLAPQTESLSWAKGCVPHPKGEIRVDWYIRGNNLFYNCIVPDGVKFQVQPKGTLAERVLWVNGKRVD